MRKKLELLQSEFNNSCGELHRIEVNKMNIHKKAILNQRIAFNIYKLGTTHPYSPNNFPLK